jgi:hypothetical protein
MLDGVELFGGVGANEVLLLVRGGLNEEVGVDCPYL